MSTYTYLNCYELITDSALAELMAAMDKDKPFFSNVFTPIYTQFNLLYAFVSSDAEPDNLISLRKDRVRRNIIEWFKSKQIEFNDEYDLRTNPTSGSAESITKYNDTPQSQGSYTADTYTSNITQNESTGTLSSSEKLDLLYNMREAYISDFNRRFVIYV